MTTVEQLYRTRLERHTNLLRHEKTVAIDQTTKSMHRPPSIFSERFVGIEIEMEGVAKDNPQGLDLFERKGDGSLRNNGIEYVSWPLRGYSIERALYALKKIYSYDESLHFTHRCSIHVHVNVRDMEMERWSAMILGYLCVEELFFSLVDPLRRGNVFCAPLIEADIRTLESLAKTDYHEQAAKYFAFNYGTVSSYGTVEFRHLQGTKNEAELSRWISVCQRFVDYFNVVNVPIFYKTVLGLNTASNYDLFVMDIFGPLAQVFMNQDLHKKMAPNVSFAKQLLIKE